MDDRPALWLCFPIMAPNHDSPASSRPASHRRMRRFAVVVLVALAAVAIAPLCAWRVRLLCYPMCVPDDRAR